MNISFLREVAESGHRIFDRNTLEELIQKYNISKSYISRLLSISAKRGYIVSIGNGLYTLPTELLAGGPLHSFEIGIKIGGKDSLISHRTAMAYHNLTDQMINVTYVTVSKEVGNKASTREYTINNQKFHLIKMLSKHVWGTQNIFIGEARIVITDIERTLIDGLIMPNYCGGFRDVMFAFENSLDRISEEKMLLYIQKSPLVVAKRMGWIFEKLNYYPNFQELMKEIPSNTYQKLDSTGERRGSYNKKWMLVENI